ncbi:MAG: glycosyltransferase [Armatimonadota bacterium]
MLVSIVIPTYNSSKFIEKTIAAIDEYAASASHDVELIIVDDGSRDSTFSTLTDIAGSCKVPMVLVQLFRNRGQFHALMAGLHHAKGDYVATLDDDLEYSPDQIPVLLGVFAGEYDKYDLVIGVPEERQSSWIRRKGSLLSNRVNSILIGKPAELRTGTFRLMTRQFVANLLEYKTANPIMAQLVFQTTRRVANITVTHRHGLRPSNYSLKHLVQTFFRMAQLFSDLPLRYMSCFGFTISALSFMAGLFYIIRYIIRYLTSYPRPVIVAGWTSIIVSILFFSGIILLSIGLLGQYIFRIYEEVNKHPNYQIRRIEKYSGVEKSG